MSNKQTPRWHQDIHTVSTQEDWSQRRERITSDQANILLLGKRIHNKSSFSLEVADIY